ncbi:MAG: hypothetical protein MZV64_00900 [Ignavibacteriales bacterium]|nr:hypothetical protein [Ignavibacteriales bacterium]
MMTAKNILSNNALLNQTKLKLRRIKEVLGDKNAPQNAAKIIYTLLDEHKTD